MLANLHPILNGLHVTEIVAAYAERFEHSTVPKLFINSDPGVTLTRALREYCRRWPRQIEVTVRGLHYPKARFA